MSSPSTSHGYFESVSTQLSLSVGSSSEGVAGNSSANASQGISAGVSAVDTGMKAGMALAEARNEHAIVSFRYDNMGLPVEERSNEHVIKRTYDKSGQIATLTSSLGADLTYERNEFGELTCFSAGQAEAPGRFESRHEYDSLGFELERMLPGGVTQSFAYDDIGRLIDSKTRQSSKVRRERKYHWGKADRLLKTEDNRFGTTTYEYSPTGHLQKAVYADGREEYRLSDKAGNLFDDPDRKLRKYLRGGKLEQSGEWRFVYDRDGQLVEKYKGSGKSTHLGGGTIQISKGRTGTFTIDTNGAPGRELGGKGSIHDATFHVLKYN